MLNILMHTWHFVDYLYYFLIICELRINQIRNILPSPLALRVHVYSDQVKHFSLTGSSVA